MSIPKPARMTAQRQVILEELRKSTSHPTADEVYDQVRERLPRVSLGTIYRNLEILSQAGTIRRINASGTQRRFDARTDEHYHIRCTHCGRIDDVPMEPMAELEHALKDQCHYEVTGHWVEFSGICPECK